MQTIWLLVIWMNCNQPGLCPPGAVQYNISPELYRSQEQCDLARDAALLRHPQPTTILPRCHMITQSHLR